MSRHTLLYASPLPPEKSGVSEYSEALIQGLGRWFEVTLLSQQQRPVLRGVARSLSIKVAGRDDIQPQAFDHVLYNMGNNPYFHAFIYELFLRRPGPVILHDVVLYFLTVGYYKDTARFYGKIYELAGAEGLRIIKEQVKSGHDLLRFAEPVSLPLNGELLRRAPLILVHSESARQALLADRPDAPVHVLPMIDPYSALPVTAPARDLLRDRCGVPDSASVVASFGMIAPTKQNHRVCQAMQHLDKTGNASRYYVMVGEGDHVDRYLGDRILKTGYLPSAEYVGVLDRCDLVASLRHPSMGETSIGLLQAMSRGKPCLVTDEGWFAELPDDVVIKVAPDISDTALAQVIRTTLADVDGSAALGARAREHVRAHHDVRAVTERLADYLLEPPAPAGPGRLPRQPTTT